MLELSESRIESKPKPKQGVDEAMVVLRSAPPVAAGVDERSSGVANDSRGSEKMAERIGTGLTGPEGVTKTPRKTRMGVFACV